MQKMQKEINTSGKTFQQWKYKNLSLASFIFSLIGFLIMSGLFAFWIVLFIDESKQSPIFDSEWFNIISYALISVTAAVSFLPVIMNICFMAMTKSDSWLFLLITIILNTLLPIIVIGIFVLYNFFIDQVDQNSYIIYMIASIILYGLDLLAVFLQVNSNLVSFVESKKSINKKNKKKR